MWASVVFVFCLLTTSLTLSAAQMNLYIAKHDVNSYLSKYKVRGNALKAIQNTPTAREHHTSTRVNIARLLPSYRDEFQLRSLLDQR